MIKGSQIDVSYSWLPPESQRDGCVLLRVRTFWWDIRHTPSSWVQEKQTRFHHPIQSARLTRWSWHWHQARDARDKGTVYARADDFNWGTVLLQVSDTTNLGSGEQCSYLRFLLNGRLRLMSTRKAVYVRPQRHCSERLGDYCACIAVCRVPVTVCRQRALHARERGCLPSPTVFGIFPPSLQNSITGFDELGRTFELFSPPCVVR